MPLQFSAAVRNARLDAFETVVGASPRLRYLTGAPPANCAAPQTGTLLVEMTLPADFMNNASGGTKVQAGVWSGAAVNTGTVGHFRLVDAAGAVCHAQGIVTLTGGGGDMLIDSTSITSGQTVSNSGFSLTDNNS